MSEKPYLIGIAGPSGSGKTYLAAHLAQILPATVFSLDCYYQDLANLEFEDRARFNFDHPDSLESEMIAAHLRQLASGQDVERPVYDFSRHTRRMDITEHMAAKPYIIVEGLFTLHYPAVRELLGTAVYVDTEDPICLERRTERDIRERGRTAESVLWQYNTTVRPMALQFILPSRANAHLVVLGTAPVDESVAAVLAHAASRRVTA